MRLLKGLGVVRQRGDIVYCWPDDAMRKKKQPPLVLRLLCFHDGRGEVYLVTNILDDTELTAEHANQIYRGRWGIEKDQPHYTSSYRWCGAHTAGYDQCRGAA